MLILQDMAAHTTLLSEAPLTGQIAGTTYVAAATSGGGACGLHSLFGQSLRGELSASNARVRVHGALPNDIIDVLSTASFHGSRIVGKALEQVLQDIATAGMKTVRGETLKNEVDLLWKALPNNVREDVVALSRMKQYERAKDERLWQRLQTFFKEIFQPRYEESTVRTLCILLNYLEPTAPVDLLAASPTRAGLRNHEGPRGALELLHPCVENIGITKYQALFNPDPVYDRYRSAFFMNASNQHAGRDWLHGAVELTASHIAGESPEGQRVLLEAKTLLEERFHCYGCLERPPSVTRQLAWTMFRELILDADYYLSVQELLMIAVIWKFSLTVFQYTAGVPDEMSFAALPSYIEEDTDKHARVVLTLQEDSLRGHFSRLFSLADWETHRESCAASDLEFSDTTVSTEPSDEEGSSAEDPEAEPMEEDLQPEQDAEQRASAEAEPMEKDQNGDLESLSDISDNSDLFHVSATTFSHPRTLEDKDMAVIDTIVPYLRDYPLLPPKAGNLCESFTDVGSAQRLPLLHCAFRGCGWKCPDEDFPADAITYHLDMERLIYSHLYEEHRFKEMAQVPTEEWDDEKEITRAISESRCPMTRKMNALAYYTAAVCQKERMHVPLIGPSLDRRMLALLTRFCNSHTVSALVCVACAQIHTSVKSWTRSFAEKLQTWTGHSCASIQYRSVENTLLMMMRKNKKAFGLTFELSKFRLRYGSDAHPEGNPFASCQDFNEDQWEWRRRFPDGGEDCVVLCCPEDVRKSSYCRHDDTILCCKCLIPICSSCYTYCWQPSLEVIPLSLGSDNFCGYTTELLYQYEVRWVEAAIVMPVWTTGRSPNSVRMFENPCSFSLLASAFVFERVRWWCSAQNVLGLWGPVGCVVCSLCSVRVLLGVRPTLSAGQSGQPADRPASQPAQPVQSDCCLRLPTDAAFDVQCLTLGCSMFSLLVFGLSHVRVRPPVW